MDDHRLKVFGRNITGTDRLSRDEAIARLKAVAQNLESQSAMLRDNVDSPEFSDKQKKSIESRVSEKQIVIDQLRKFIDDLESFPETAQFDTPTETMLATGFGVVRPVS